MRKPCKCCATIGDYIASHLDPNATLRHDDDADDVVASLDDCFADEGGAGVSADEMQDYLDSLQPDGKHS